MKERFDNRLMTGKIKVSCKKEGKVAAVWEARKEDIVDAIINITENEMRNGLNISLRGLFYKLVSQNLILNYLEPYSKLGRIVDDCRYSGLLDWDAIKVDGARGVRLDYSVDDIPDALQDTVDQYKLDRQEGQPNYIEVWCEKETLVDRLRRTTNKYHIPLCIVKGNNSSSAVYRGYQRFREELYQDRPVKLLYFGDHDPSGLDMIRDIRERTLYMLENSTLDYSKYNWNMVSTHAYKSNLPDYFEVIPVALTMDQITQYKLPSNYAKESNNLTPWYEEQFGTKQCWEVDALDGSVLTATLEAAIINNIDLELYAAVMEREKADRQLLRAFMDTNNK